jgi:hypothetical protein
MRAFICSRDDTVTRLDCDDATIEAQPVLDGVPVNCVAADGDRVIVGTQGAGALLSSDGGRRWERIELPEWDVTSVAIGPADGTLYAGTEPSRPFVLRGVMLSEDGGRSWSALDAGRELGYCWALAADPADPDRWYVSAAPGPRGAHSAGRAYGRLYRWDGDAWRELRVPGQSMPYTLGALADEPVRGMADGRMLRSRDRGESWQELAVTAPIIAMALAA